MRRTLLYTVCALAAMLVVQSLSSAWTFANRLQQPTSLAPHWLFAAIFLWLAGMVVVLWWNNPPFRLRLLWGLAVAATLLWGYLFVHVSGRVDGPGHSVVRHSIMGGGWSTRMAVAGGEDTVWTWTQLPDLWVSRRTFLVWCSEVSEVPQYPKPMSRFTLRDADGLLLVNQPGQRKPIPWSEGCFAQAFFAPEPGRRYPLTLDFQAGQGSVAWEVRLEAGFGLSSQ